MHRNIPTAEVIEAMEELSRRFKELDEVIELKSSNLDQFQFSKAEKDVKLFTPMSAGPPKKRGKGKYVKY